MPNRYSAHPGPPAYEYHGDAGNPAYPPSYQPEGNGAYPPYSGSPGYGGHHSGDEPPKIGFALTLRQGPPATVSSVGGLWRSVALGGDRSAGAGTVQCDFFCSVGLENAQATPHFSGATSCSNSPTFPAADPLTLFGPRTLDRSCGFYVHAVFY